MNNILQKDEEEKVKKAINAFDDFMHTMDDISKTQKAVINETNRQLELKKIEMLKKQIN